MVEFICNLILMIISIFVFCLIIWFVIINPYIHNKKYKKFIEELKIGDKFYAGTLTYDNPFDDKEDEDIFFFFIDLKYNQHNELFAKVKWSDNKNISVITADKLYWEYTKIY